MKKQHSMENMLECYRCKKFATIGFLTLDNRTFCSKDCVWSHRFDNTLDSSKVLHDKTFSIDSSTGSGSSRSNNSDKQALTVRE